MEEIQKELQKRKDEKYAEFSKNIVPTTSLIYVRMPDVKQIAKKFANTKAGDEFLCALPHSCPDEYNVHGIMLGNLKCSKEELIEKIEEFLPYIDNWATCDTTCASLKIVKKYPDFFKKYIKKWLKSERIYTKRFAIVLLLDHYLDDNFDEQDFELLNFDSSEYYVNMALAWYYSVALVKQFDKAIKLFEDKNIKNNFVYNKAIQKAVESFRISDEQKKYLKTLKV